MNSKLTPDQDRAAISLIRGIAMDAPLAAKSGHQGTAMALAPLAHVLYSRVLNHDPAHPDWPNRDRFILSNGHASILQYAMLFLSGYGLEIPDLKNFRQWGSATPGHPEVGHTAGVEVTTGPLGQGFANAVGMAIAETHLRAVHGAGHTDHWTYVLAGDGCLMEGISHEAASLAGHLGLSRLVCIFDDNRITIDGSIDLTCSDDVPMRFRSYGWNVMEIGDVAEDCDRLEAALLEAKSSATNSPTLIVLRTHIGYPSPDLTDRHEAHGNPFTQDLVTATKRVMGIPDEPFWAPEELVSAYREHAKSRGAALREAWMRDSGDGAAGAKAVNAVVDSSTVSAHLPRFSAEDNPATRQAFQKVLEATDSVMPSVLAGAADLTGNTGSKLSGTVPFDRDHPEGRQIYFGIREHAMGAALVGMALHGGVIPVGGTFFVFADYMRPSIRLAALSRARCVFVFSHDSVGVGEDGPTHQPIEQLASLRMIPGLQVIRPADGNETAQAWLAAVTHDGPTALILSRQNLPTTTDGSAVSTGAGIVRSAKDPRAVIIGTGSEVALAVRAADALAADGIEVNVVSMPSWDRFAAQTAAFQESVLPAHLPRVSVEAGTTFGWSRYATKSLGIDRFGASAPGSVVMDQLGVSVDNLTALVRSTIPA